MIPGNARKTWSKRDKEEKAIKQSVLERKLSLQPLGFDPSVRIRKECGTGLSKGPSVRGGGAGYYPPTPISYWLRIPLNERIPQHSRLLSTDRGDLGAQRNPSAKKYRV